MSLFRVFQQPRINARCRRQESFVNYQAEIILIFIILFYKYHKYKAGLIIKSM